MTSFLRTSLLASTLLLAHLPCAAAQSAPVTMGTLTGGATLPLPADLATVLSAEFSASGMLVVQGERTGPVLVFDSALHGYTSVGRRGEGPGEFQSIGNISWKGDTLVVDDSRNWRLSLFANGTKLAREINEHGWLYPAVSPRAFTADGRWIGVSRPGSGTRTGLSRDSLYVLAIDERNPGVVTKLVTQVAPRLTVTARIGNSSVMMQQPFADWSLQDYSPKDRSIVTFGGGPQPSPSQAAVVLTWYDPDGRMLTRRSYAFPATPADPGRKKSMVDGISKSYGDRIHASAADVARFREQLDDSIIVPAIQPAARGMYLDNGTGVWFTALRDKLPMVLCRTTRTSAATLCAPLPEKTSPVAVDAWGRVIMLIRDADDVPALKVFQLKG